MTKLYLYYSHESSVNKAFLGILLIIIAIVRGLINLDFGSDTQIMLSVGIVVTILGFLSANDSSPCITLDETGLRDHRYDKFIAWDTVKTIRLHQIRHRHHVHSPALRINESFDVDLNELFPSN